VTAQHTNGWTADAGLVPDGFDGVNTSQAEFRIEAGVGESGQGNACVLDYVDRRDNSIASQPTVALGKHLTGDQNTGFDELYVRYKVRLPDGWAAGDDSGSTLPYWKWMRLWQNTTPSQPGGNWTENRVDSYYIVTNFGGSPNEPWGVDINSTWGRPYDSDDQGSAGGPRVAGDWYQGLPTEDHAITSGYFEHVGGNWDSNEGPVTRGAWELGSDYTLLNAGQTWHTIEYRFKLATGQPTNEGELNWDGVLEVWFDGVKQIGLPNTEFSGSAWPPHNNNDSAPGLPTTRVGSGLNWIGIFDNMAVWNTRWLTHSGLVYLDDVVVSTQRIRHDYVVNSNMFIPGMGT
jgi:hypothetical protein